MFETQKMAASSANAATRPPDSPLLPTASRTSIAEHMYFIVVVTVKSRVLSAVKSVKNFLIAAYPHHYQ
jgi:hypothetical protein